MGMFDKGRGGLTWDYLKDRHSEILSELAILRDWETVKAVIPEAEKLGDYSLLALQAIASLIREFNTERNLIGERIDNLEKKLDETRTEMRERDNSLEKRISELEKTLQDIRRKIILVEGVGNIIPRINEIEEKLESGQAEILAKLEKRYLKLVEDRVEELVKKHLESALPVSATGISEVLRELQQENQRLILENYKLREKIEPLQRSLRKKELEVRELQAKLAQYKQLEKTIEELQKRVQEYERRASSLSTTEKKLLEITGAPSVEAALEMVKTMKREYVPKSKVAPILDELKRLRQLVEELESENKALREKNEKLSQALKMLIEREESSSEE